MSNSLLKQTLLIVRTLTYNSLRTGVVVLEKCKVTILNFDNLLW